ncbi:hypothetical protein K491DRAFT_773086 [Lophiostoma macrostomum CBS 122681]|uniref:Uncharacterized protein n=1 Tax=Lophiostoma macrostomum CBS 122681 TaxID=1314788 RepID=A0A6A6TTA4_9PLEO|nr:hypothetical protein K491DRAFT_773086 [Lophiostoma macrostomum CBS 122681]
MSPREPPPNTPDRPAPLNIRSRENSGKLSEPTTALFRSASTPIRPRPAARFLDVPSDVLEVTAELARLAHDNEGGEMDSQFPSESGSDWTTESETSQAPQATQYRYSEDTRIAPESVVDNDDVAEDVESALGVRSQRESTSSTTEVASTCETDETAATSSPAQCPRRPVSDSITSRFNPRSAYTSSPSQGSGYSLGIPRARSVNQESKGKRASLYQFATGPAPTPAQRRAAAQSRRQTRTGTSISTSFSGLSGTARQLPFRSLEHVNDSTSTSATDSDEPAPFRRFEILASNGGTPSSKLIRFDSEASLSHFRAHPMRSVTQPSPARKGNAHQIMGLDEMAIRVGPNTIRASRHASLRLTTRSALDETFLDSTSRLFGAPQTAIRLEAPAASATGSLSEAYKSVTSAYIASLLQRTQTRGAQLPLASRDDMDADEIIWRDSNEAMIMRVYGRKNIQLTSADKQYLDRLAKAIEMAEDIPGNEWAVELFHLE